MHYLRKIASSFSVPLQIFSLLISKKRFFKGYFSPWYLFDIILLPLVPQLSLDLTPLFSMPVSIATIHFMLIVCQASGSLCSCLYPLPERCCQGFSYTSLKLLIEKSFFDFSTLFRNLYHICLKYTTFFVRLVIL